MKEMLQWQGRRGGEDNWFPASVPGSIQHDYGIYMAFPDIHYGENAELYRQFEDDVWFYRTKFDAPSLRDKEHLFFVTDGIEYEYEIRFNNVLLIQHEGMFTRVEADLTTHMLPRDNLLEVRILPHPTSDCPRGTGRNEAAHTCKPAVQYGWDWHPRLLSSGMWQEAWLETRGAGYIRTCSCFYELNERRDTAYVRFEIDCDEETEIHVQDGGGNTVYKGVDPEFTVENVRLWWCNGQGEPYLYSYTVSNRECRRCGTIGFRTVELVMNEGSWKEPSLFPKSRSNPPATIRLNGREIFAKGSNWVRPELFPGEAGEGNYAPLLQMAKDAHMNILRCWGGSEICKDSFYDLCDKLGIMVWQEFPLACNCYPDQPHYLKILEQEAVAVIKRLREHPSLMLWCGGNELFNNWSGMTEQSLPLRLLNRLCYELDREKPFIMTSPLMGMGHGSYQFLVEKTGQDVFQTFQQSHCTAYTEFGVSGPADVQYLKTIIPAEELFPVKPGGAWEKHHALNAWIEDSWLCQSTLEHYVGKLESIEELCNAGHWLQCEGYKAIFEEARRQWPACSMAINWCYNEPWKTAANNSLISYPDIPKPCYEAVKSALRPVMPSARIPKFDWQEDELFTAELWLLNDSPNPVEDTVTAVLELDGCEQKIICWETGVCAPNHHQRGHRIQWRLPHLSSGVITLRLEAGCGCSQYILKYRPKAQPTQKKILNL